MVNQAVEQLGGFDDFAESESDKQNSSDQTKKLYRDPEYRVIGGVSSGLANYFGIES